MAQGITPGPWAVDESYRSKARIVQAADVRQCIAEMPPPLDPWWGGSRKERITNARAIAAVPEMIEALEVVQAISRALGPPDIFTAVRLADAVLTKIQEG